jgi:hypothetical protein
MKNVRGTARLVAGHLVLMLCAAGCDETSLSVSPDVMGVAQEGKSTPQQSDLRTRIGDVLDTTKRRHMAVGTNAAWQVVHGILAFGPELSVTKDGQTVPALSYLLNGGPLLGWNLRPGDRGIEAPLEEGSKTGQGHEDQWLGYLSQCRVPLDQLILVAGERRPLADLLSQAKWDVYDGMEATWTLMALAEYAPLDDSWKARDGSDWSFERVLHMEADYEFGSGACGGSHRLYALCLARNRYMREKGPLTGPWLEADQRIRQATERAFAYQSADGGFSTDLFAGPARAPDAALQISSTGHVLEFLAIALDEQRVREPWVERSVKRLCQLLEDTEDVPLECGGLYHAAHGLALYRQRIYEKNAIGPPMLATPSPSPTPPIPLPLTGYAAP